MSTSAAVYIVALDKAVRINADGFPDSTGVALERIVSEGLLESFARHDEYSFLSRTGADYDTYAADKFSNRYVKVDQVGFAFPEDDSAEISATLEDGVYVFDSYENYNYVIHTDGVVALQKR